MKVVILYRPKSEHASTVEAYIHDYKARYGDNHMELVDVDSRDGIAMAELYDIMQYPAILAVGNDGTLAQSWEGETLPLMDDVAFYASTQG